MSIGLAQGSSTADAEADRLDAALPADAVSGTADATADTPPMLPAATWPWRATHESNTFSDWEQPFSDVRGGFYASQDATIAITDDRSHEGRHAIKVVLSGTGITQWAKVYRKGTFPLEFRFGAWFYVPEAYVVTNYWNVMQISAPVAENAPDQLLWDVTMSHVGDANVLYLYEHPTRRVYGKPGQPVPVPVGRWFKIELFVRRATNRTGQLVLFQDGVPIVEVKDVVTALDEVIGLNMGSAAPPDEATPLPLVLYIDDAAIVPGPL